MYTGMYVRLLYSPLTYTCHLQTAITLNLIEQLREDQLQSVSSKKGKVTRSTVHGELNEWSCATELSSFEFSLPTGPQEFHCNLVDVCWELTFQFFVAARENASTSTPRLLQWKLPIHVAALDIPSVLQQPQRCHFTLS